MSLTGNAPLVAPLIGRDTGLADAGATYVASMPTLGTGVIGTVNLTSQAIGDLAPYFTCYNGGSLNIYPLYWRAYVTVIGAGGTVCQYTMTTDVTNRVTTLGTAMVINNTNIGTTQTPQGVNPSAFKSAAVIQVGAIVAGPAVAERVVGHVLYRGTTQNIVWDEIGFSWGSPDSCSVGTPLEPATAMSRWTNLPALVIGPGQYFSIFTWNGSRTTHPTLHVEFCYGER